ncbi:hypothetical protein CORT_0A08010 [Candida orthopsilosis Co 90-125]|uniref:AP-2 complex subunit alpha n=1 Tax=Candida orthopsilosis (strain 90-125) TaxID=1136231 RepID=H8WX47_CANO9|nr:hypothetical protein CORT_0A08010 [Candida orthopsilosis Co 90-125]CCG21187.1 hypothetical protein CORT_0A08010 [Candida orthopsilosis Co 90-125]
MKPQDKLSQKNQMKGLHQFIVDLRNSKDQEEEYKKIRTEANTIQNKFQSTTSLNNYQKKKYICKLIYIFISGYSELVNFGLNESIELIKSSIFSDKKLGYLAVSVLLNNESPNSISLYTSKEHLNHILEITHPYLVQDLRSSDEEVNCLAIQMIATCFTASDTTIFDGDGNAIQWMELIDVVFASATSPLQKPVVKQKALITLKSLLQLYPDVIIKNSNWIPRLLKIVEESSDIGVVTASVPLLDFILTIKPLLVRSVLPSVTQRLYSLTVLDECPSEYYYYNTPAPWLTVKLLQFVENNFLVSTGSGETQFSADQIDSVTLNQLRQVVSKSIQNASHHIKGLPNRNSRSSILFQAVSLAVFLEASPEAIAGASNALLNLIVSNDTNTRYLALDALIKLTARSESPYLSTKDKFGEILPIFVNLLKDKDISVRRKTLDLLYTICNDDTYSVILNELLLYFPHADQQMKQELAIKIAILAERFATDSTWYVTTMLKLLSIGGGSNANGVGFISNEVWERIVQIVVNNDDLHKKTAKMIINLMKKPFGNSQSPVSEYLIKVAAFVLGEFGHEVNDLNETNVGVQFRLLYDAYFGVSISTRAMLLSSFLKFLVKFPEADFVPEIVDLFEVETQSLDLEIQGRAYEYLKLSTVHSDFRLAKTVIKPVPAFNQQESPLLKRLGVLPNRPGVSRSKSRVLARNIKTKPENGNVATGEGAKDNALTNNWYSGFHRMLHFDAGIFYENNLIKITYRLVKSNNEFVIQFTIINNASKTVGETITGFNVLKLDTMAKKEDPNYLLSITHLPESTIADRGRMDISVKVRGVVENHEDPIISLTFMCGGSFNQLNLKFPVQLIKTLTSAPIRGIDEFEKRWGQIEEHLGLEKGESMVVVHLSHRHDAAQICRSLSRIGFTVLTESDHGINVIGAGIIHTQKSNYGVLVKLLGLDIEGKDLKIIVRCTGGGVADIISSAMKEIFVGKYN